MWQFVSYLLAMWNLVAYSFHIYCKCGNSFHIYWQCCNSFHNARVKPHIGCSYLIWSACQIALTNCSDQLLWLGMAKSHLERLVLTNLAMHNSHLERFGSHRGCPDFARNGWGECSILIIIPSGLISLDVSLHTCTCDTDHLGCLWLCTPTYGRQHEVAN